MSELDMCENLTVEILEFEKPIVIDIDFEGEFFSSSDGEDYKRGYEDGHAQGLVDGRADGYQEGYEKGKAEGDGDNYYDIFWDDFQQNGERTDYRYAFTYAGWNDTCFKPKYDIKPLECSHMFLYSQIIDLKSIFEKQGVVLDTSQVAEMAQMFFASQCTYIPSLDLSSCTNAGQAWRNCTKLKQLELKNVQTNCIFGNAFTYCTRLVDFICTGSFGNSISFGTSNLLSEESVQNIIDCLADLTGQTAQTLTFHKDIEARMSDEQKAQVVSKNWTIAFSK